ncbi:nucleoside deaminase [Runella sp.]|uniref:nucleoside deaminase n=1 Tax=Runella sp. TaxID=1960881 RepID=UPI003D0E40D3
MPVSSTFSNEHEFFMARCIELALIAKQRGDAAVGSVLVLKGKIIAEGIEGGKTYQDITCHAEMEAIRHARLLLKTHILSECILYTTHEPCIMCSYAIRHSQIKTIVMALTTGNIGGMSSQYPLLLDTSIEKWGNPPTLVTGILEDECRNLKS